MKRSPLSRRTVLRGLLGGAITTVALPPLEVMYNAHGTALAGGSTPPLRFMTYCIANGVRLDRWVPSAQGEAYPLSEELAPIANVQDYCSVLSGFQNRCEQRITHHEGMTVFNGYSFVEQDGLFSKAGGPTIDQVIADKIAGYTPFKSLQVQISKRLSIMDSGTTLFYLSHRGPNQPLSAELNPRALWSKLFNSYGGPNDPSIALRVNVLDSVREDVVALKRRLGQADIQRLDSHLEGLSELEKQITALPPACDLPQQPTETNEDVEGAEPLTSVHAAMVDLLAYTFSCDLSRVASFLVTGGAAETVFSEIGQSSVHHANTHNIHRQKEVHEVVIYNMQQFAYMLEKFKATPDGMNGECLLDNMAILLSSDCSEGYTHDIFDQPIVVAGRAGGRLRHPGVHYRSPNGENTTDILVSLLEALAPETAGVGVGSGAPFSNTPCAALNPA